MSKLAITAVLLLVASPALALYEYYVVHDAAARTCDVVEQKPPSGGTKIVVGGAVYRTKGDAENALKAAKECVQ